MRYFILTLLLSFTFSECDELTEMQCASNADCEWITTYQWYNCNNFQNYTQCNNYSEYGCYWYDHWYYSGWDSCNGPSFQVENGGYCQNNPDYMQGDLNGDLILNILDVIIIVDIILNQESSDLADINGDGIVNILDVIELVDIIVNG